MYRMECKLSIDKNKKPGLPSLLFSNILVVLLPVVFGFSSIKSLGQAKLIKLYPTAGITWRSTAVSSIHLYSSYRTSPYDYERNVQGFSLNPGIQLEFRKVGFEYYTNLRYDVVHSKTGALNDYVKDFLLDHNINLFYHHKIQYGLGMSIVNSGKGFEFVYRRVPKYHNIEFKTYNIFVTIPVKKIVFLEIKALYVPKDFPENQEAEYLMFSLRAYYKFDFLNKRKEL